MFDVLDLLNQLLRAVGPSGRERACAESIAVLAKPFVDEIYYNNMGSLICRKKGTGPKLLAAAHMDAIGFMVSSVDEDGFLSFIPIGAHPAARLIGMSVRFSNGTEGIIFAENFESLADRPFGKVTVRDLYIDIGARTKEEALSHVVPGDTAVFTGRARMLQGNKLCSPYLDDLIGCVALLLAMEEQLPSENDRYYVFTAQEELIARGAGPAAAQICPDMALAVDICHTGDSPGYNRKIIEALGKGPAIKLFDLSAICDEAVISHLRGCATAAGIRCQDEIAYTGGTDAGAMQRSGLGVLTGGISIPSRYSHTPLEICDLDDVHLTGRLLARALADAPTCFQR